MSASRNPLHRNDAHRTGGGGGHDEGPDEAATPLARFRAFLHRVPLKLLLLISLFSLLTGEFYPFSSFPMYSRFTPYTYYLYVTDGNQRMLDFDDTFNLGAGPFKKTFSHMHRTEREHAVVSGGTFEQAEQIAGRRALEFLAGRMNREGVTFPLHLVHVDVERTRQGLERRERVIGELDRP